jgi:hypothetical protein
MTKKDITNAWAEIRQSNNTIPDEVLDFMKDAAIEKLPAPARNEVHSIAAAEKEINDHIHSYYFFTSQKIDKEKLPIVKKTIENCINGEDDLKLFRGIEDTIRPFEKAYTKSQLEEAERKIWDAARQPLPYHQFTFRYQTFDDYKKQNP